MSIHTDLFNETKSDGGLTWVTSLFVQTSLLSIIKIQLNVYTLIGDASTLKAAIQDRKDKWAWEQDNGAWHFRNDVDVLLNTPWSVLVKDIMPTGYRDKCAWIPSVGKAEDVW